jgi:type III secretory pathway component EscV
MLCCKTQNHLLSGTPQDSTARHAARSNQLGSKTLESPLTDHLSMTLSMTLQSAGGAGVPVEQRLEPPAWRRPRHVPLSLCRLYLRRHLAGSLGGVRVPQLSLQQQQQQRQQRQWWQQQRKQQQQQRQQQQQQRQQQQQQRQQQQQQRKQQQQQQQQRRQQQQQQRQQQQRQRRRQRQRQRRRQSTLDKLLSEMTDRQILCTLPEPVRL